MYHSDTWYGTIGLTHWRNASAVVRVTANKWPFSVFRFSFP